MRATLLFDAHCGVCRKEMARIARWDRRELLSFADIRDPAFDAASWGVNQEAVLRRLHAVTEEGELRVGMDAVRLIYQAAGLGWLLAPTAWPILRPLFDRAYLWVADHRFAISRWLGLACENGQCHLEESP